MRSSGRSPCQAAGPIERALITVVVERFFALQGLSRHWHGTLRLAGVVVGYNRSPEASWPETLRALVEALAANLGSGVPAERLTAPLLSPRDQGR